MSESDEEKAERLRKMLPPGLGVATGADYDDASVIILEELADGGFPWDSPPMVVFVHEHDGGLHPIAIVPLLTYRDSSGWTVISITQLAEYMPPFVPDPPLSAIGFVNEIYIGSREVEDPDVVTQIGDAPGDMEARIAIVRFVGGGTQRAIHLREQAVTARWGKPGEDQPFRTTKSSPQDEDVIRELDFLLNRINNP